MDAVLKERPPAWSGVREWSFRGARLQGQRSPLSSMLWMGSAFSVIALVSASAVVTAKPDLTDALFSFPLVLDFESLLAITGMASIVMAAVWWLVDFDIKAGHIIPLVSTNTCVSISVVTLLLYPAWRHVKGFVAARDILWIDYTHFQLEFLSFSICCIAVGALCLADSFVNLPVIALRERRDGTFSLGNTLKMYVHHVICLVGIWVMFLDVRACGRVDVRQYYCKYRTTYPVQGIDVPADCSGVSASDGPFGTTSQEAAAFHLLCNVWLANRFLFPMEISSWLLNLRSILRLDAQRSNVPTNPWLREVVGQAFALSFFAARVLPLWPALVNCLNYGSDASSHMGRAVLGSYARLLKNVLGYTEFNQFSYWMGAFCFGNPHLGKVVVDSSDNGDLERWALDFYTVALPYCAFALLNLMWFAQVAKGAAKGLRSLFASARKDRVD